MTCTSARNVYIGITWLVVQENCWEIWYVGLKEKCSTGTNGQYFRKGAGDYDVSVYSTGAVPTQLFYSQGNVK